MRARRILVVASIVSLCAVGAAPLAVSASFTTNVATARPIGLSRFLAASPPQAVTRGIATFDQVPQAAQVGALKRLGLTVQPMRHLPLALVRGTTAQIAGAVRGGIANDVYPDDKVQLLDRVSADAMGTARPRSTGFTGKGVTVAVVDSGCDASHPDLADHVVHNVKLVSAEYVNMAPDSSNTIVVPIDQLPYNNSDIGSGHGTHVSGIVAADGHTDPSHIGVAPDAELVCVSIGEVLFTTAVVTAYDYLLDQPGLWGIDVINNSWGNMYRQFDPRDPVAVATRAVSSFGVVVVFAAGNAGPAEMSLNPFAQPPWVISAAAGTLDHHLADFSSRGLQFDNALPVTIGPGGHTAFLGNRIGMYHPDVAAPGEAISSTCDTLGTLVGPCPPGENAEAGGTSMASPHVAGAAAVLLQANPRLTIDQVRRALQATATPVFGQKKGSKLPFWEAGYGYVNLARAVDLVRRHDYAKAITNAQASADKRVLASIGFTVRRSDFWAYDAPRAAIAGTDHHVYQVAVAPSVTHVKIALAHPSLGALGANGMQYDVELRDSAGRLLATSTESDLGSGTSSLLVDLKAAKAKYGMFTIDVSGMLAVSDPDTLDSDSVLGRMVTLQVAQLSVRR